MWTVHVHTVDSTIIDMQQGEVVEVSCFLIYIRNTCTEQYVWVNEMNFLYITARKRLDNFDTTFTYNIFALSFPLQGFKWVEADESQTKIKEAKLLPLKSMSSPVMEVSNLISVSCWKSRISLSIGTQDLKDLPVNKETKLFNSTYRSRLFICKPNCGIYHISLLTELHLTFGIVYFLDAVVRRRIAKQEGKQFLTKRKTTLFIIILAAFYHLTISYDN